MDAVNILLIGAVIYTIYCIIRTNNTSPKKIKNKAKVKKKKAYKEKKSWKKS